MPAAPDQFLRISPHTVTDSFYSYPEGAPAGMAILSDFVPSLTSQDQWLPRPAAVELLDQLDVFDGVFISATIIIGNILYGMRASKAVPGKDEPFAYDLINQAPIPVTGIVF